MKIKCIIVDDEPLAIRLLESHIEKLPEISIIAKCENAMQAMAVIQKEEADLILLDIQMPELTGLEFLQAMQNPPQVIFTTAYRNYAIDAFEFDVVDYLLKPISFERFVKAINKFYLRTNRNPKVVPGNNKLSESKFIYIKKNKTVFKILIDEIKFIKSIKDYIKIHTTNEDHMTKQMIGKLESLLPDSDFIRVHNSYIVNIQHIDSISPNYIGIKEEKIPIGRSFKNYVLKKLDYYHNI